MQQRQSRELVKEAVANCLAVFKEQGLADTNIHTVFPFLGFLMRAKSCLISQQKDMKEC